MTIMPNDDEWLALLERSVTEKVELDGQFLPGFPPIDFQMGTTGMSGCDAVRHGWEFASETLREFDKSPLFGDENKTLMDFGCSWGRVSRCFLRDFKLPNIVGLDVSAHSIERCRKIFPGLRLEKCNVFPPTVLKDESVDFIVGYSVFSHLSEIACSAWAAEFFALLKPGGRAVVTTRSRDFFDRHRDHLVARFGAAPMFHDYAAAKEKYDRGYVVHSDTEAGRVNRDHYSETFIPRAYAERAYLPLRLVDFYDRGGTSVIVFEKP